MSRRLQDLFWDIDLSGTEQLVAQRLAWHANDEDARCWPGMALLVDKTGLSERAIQNAIKALVAGDHLTRIERRGHGVVYIVHPRTTCAPQPANEQDQAPAADAPPHDVHPRSRCGDPRTTCAQTVQEPGIPNDGSAGAVRDRVEQVTGQRGRRIDLDWQPVVDLPDTIAKVVAGWPPGRLQEVLDEFRDFWLAEAGARAAKRDWDKTWHNRLRAVIARDRERGDRRRGTTDGGNGPRNPMAAAAARSLAHSDG